MITEHKVAICTAVDYRIQDCSLKICNLSGTSWSKNGKLEIVLDVRVCNPLKEAAKRIYIRIRCLQCTLMLKFLLFMGQWTNYTAYTTVKFEYLRIDKHSPENHGRTVNKEHYLEVMCWLRGAIRKKRTELWKNQSWILYHDKTSTHTSMLVREFLAKNKTAIMHQPPYSPDLAPADWRRRR